MPFATNVTALAQAGIMAVLRETKPSGGVALSLQESPSQTPFPGNNSPSTPCVALVAEEDEGTSGCCAFPSALLGDAIKFLQENLASAYPLGAKRSADPFFCQCSSLERKWICPILVGLDSEWREEFLRHPELLVAHLVNAQSQARSAARFAKALEAVGRDAGRKLVRSR